MNRTDRKRILYVGMTACLVLLSLFSSDMPSGWSQSVEQPDQANPLLIVERQVRVFGWIFPRRFNTAQGQEARYHFLVWQGGASPNALIQTPADDLDFHDALVRLGAQPGDNLPMAAWTQRHNHNHSASKQTVTGSQIDIRIAWPENPTGIPLKQLFRNSVLSPQSSVLSPRFGGNRDRWFNRVPFAPRPGCLVCLYSCPSGKVSNAGLSIADYVKVPDRFRVDSARLPPDGTPVVVSFTPQS